MAIPSLRAAAVALCLLLPAATLAARVEPETQAETKLAKLHGPPKARHSDPVDLAAPSAAEKAQVGGFPKQGEPPKIGFGRPVVSLGDETQSARHLAWEDTPSGGKVASVTVTSPQAAALRLGIRVRSVPAEAVFRFHSVVPAEAGTQALDSRLRGNDQIVEVTGDEILEVLAQNLEAGEHGIDARTYWSPPIEGESVAMEIELPAGTSPKDVKLSVPQVSHLSASARTGFVDVITKASATCENDAMCVQGAWGPQMNAVARMVFTSGGSSFLCTGTLLADNDPATQVPYFLTANHCLGSQAVASTLVTYWFYRASGCNSGSLGAYQTLTGGAALLYNSTATDTSFVRLNATPPAGAVYSGWTSEAIVTPGTPITALHHPKGDLLKYSTGTMDAYISCSAPVNGSFSCNASSAVASGFYDVLWNSGVVEGGSSGSGLFLSNGKYLVGQLYGGTSTCADPASGDTYGRFDVAYNAALSQWLAPPRNVALAVATGGQGLGSVTSAPSGIACPGTCSANFSQGTNVTLTASAQPASAFTGWSGACSGTGSCVVAMNAAASVTANFGYGGVAWPAVGALPVGYGGSGSGWSVVTGAPGGETFEGATAMRSNATADGASATLTYAAQFSAGPVTFARRVSSLANAGTLRFFIDATPVGSWSGEVPWSLVSFPIGAGLHTLTWTYDKRIPGAAGSDAAWIDALNLPANAPAASRVAIALQGDGAGLVTSSPAGIDCGGACAYSFTQGSTITLNVVPLAGSRFEGWSGGPCAGSGSCTFPVASPLNVTATFTQVSGTHKPTLWSW